MIPIKMMSQPNDVTCGPTSLHSVYRYYGYDVPLDNIISEISYLETGGTLAVMLACHALQNGFDAKIYTYNLNMFDPSWFTNNDIDLAEKLKKQYNCKSSKRIRQATGAYIEFLSLGGQLLNNDLTSQLLNQYFSNQIPILTGLSSTYLYQCKREMDDPVTNRIIHNDVEGYPAGHFVVLCGYDEATRNIAVADPLYENPISGNNYYFVDIQRLVNSILLGILTYDSNLLVIQPKNSIVK
jgi:hypothetical protein